MKMKLKAPFFIFLVAYILEILQFLKDNYLMTKRRALIRQVMPHYSSFRPQPTREKFLGPQSHTDTDIVL